MDTQNPQQKSNISVWLVVFGVAILCTIGLRISQWFDATPIVPLLTQAPGLIQLTKPEDVSRYSQTLFSLPTNTFGNDLFVIGVYPTATTDFPEQSIAFVYIKDNARTFELDVLSKGYLVEQKSLYKQFPQDLVTIKSPNDGLLVHLRSGFDCVKPKKDHPGLCQITALLFFERGDQLYKLSVDGTHLSDGELLKIARSIN